MAEDRFYLVCAAFFEQRLLDHVNQNLNGEDVTVKALSSTWSALTLNGPRSRDVLAQCTDADLSNQGFRWLSAQEITVAGHRIWAFRMSYAGELGLGVPHAERGLALTSTMPFGRRARPTASRTTALSP